MTQQKERECEIVPVSSRVCERGTKSCTVRHTPTSQSEWIEELRSLWQTTRENQGKYAKIKSFISTLLAQTEKRVREERDREILAQLPKEIELGVDIRISAEDYAKSWNDCLRIVRSLLTSK